mmetsp:Transcript_39318/g.83924  ORF Transcript_39318/g.83924 Transcript_39318/m.83924 type:complete len:213 (+) Transcript_39318:710-1348(+)
MLLPSAVLVPQGFLRARNLDQKPARGLEQDSPKLSHGLLAVGHVFEDVKDDDSVGEVARQRDVCHVSVHHQRRVLVGLDHEVQTYLIDAPPRVEHLLHLNVRTKVSEAKGYPSLSTLTRTGEHWHNCVALVSRRRRAPDPTATKHGAHAAVPLPRLAHRTLAVRPRPHCVGAASVHLRPVPAAARAGNSSKITFRVRVVKINQVVVQRFFGR